MGKLLLGIVLAVFVGSLFALPDYYTQVTVWWATSSNVTFNLTTINNGTAASNASISNYSATGGVQGAYGVYALPASGRYPYYVSVACSPGQTIWMYGQADRTNAIAESNEWNNVGYGSWTCQAQQQPDLIASASGTGGNKVVGVPFTVNVTTSNIGSASTGVASTTRVRFGWGATDLAVPVLAAGGTNTQPATFTCPYAGAFTLNTTADANFNVAESNENNNFVSYQVNCVAGNMSQPDLTISTLTAPTTVIVGRSFTYTVETYNNGPGASSPSVTFAAFQTSGSNILIPGLPAGMGQVNTVTSVCSSTGRFQLTATADSTHTNSETNEANNARSVYVRCFGRIEGNATNATESSISPGPLPSDRSAAVLGALGIGIDIRKLLGSLGIVFGK